ncbi:MAG TPA: transcriptional regulator, partial [Phycisphaerales bacterium]|nr:transcriptional regulator [Phycisphaerales bacterium]
IVFCLLAGRRRFTELRRDIPSISQKMLTQELRALERDGLVRREQFQEIPPRVEYSLTELGESMAAIITEIEKWRPKLCEVARARAEYDQR